MHDIVDVIIDMGKSLFNVFLPVWTKVDRFIGGYCFTVMPDRRENSKFFIPFSMYPDRYYPTYCSGPGYVLSRRAIADVLAVAPDVLFLPMEDVFVSGICRVASGILYTQVGGSHGGGRAVQVSVCLQFAYRNLPSIPSD